MCKFIALIFYKKKENLDNILQFCSRAVYPGNVYKIDNFFLPLKI